MKRRSRSLPRRGFPAFVPHKLFERQIMSERFVKQRSVTERVRFNALPERTKLVLDVTGRLVNPSPANAISCTFDALEYPFDVSVPGNDQLLSFAVTQCTNPLCRSDFLFRLLTRIRGRISAGGDRITCDRGRFVRFLAI